MRTSKLCKGNAAACGISAAVCSCLLSVSGSASAYKNTEVRCSQVVAAIGGSSTADMSVTAVVAVTGDTTLGKYLKVSPTEIVWIYPEYTSDMDIKSNTDWNIN